MRMGDIEKETEAFCGHCDYRGDRMHCEMRRQIKHVNQGYCSFSAIEGVAIMSAKRDGLNIGGVSYDRDEVEGIAYAVNEGRAALEGMLN